VSANIVSESTLTLHAGPVTVDFDNGDLRNIRVGGIEVIRRIYLAFQDKNWTARPWVLSNVEIAHTADAFSIHFDAQGTFDAHALKVNCILSGAADGSVTYSVSGTTTEPFLRNRLGLCVLHPLTLAGTAIDIERSDGHIELSAFPDAIDPDQPFLDIRAMTHEVIPGLRARLELTGEVFESEDHRNWSDASYKTYCTPISLPFPVTVEPTWELHQSAALTFVGAFPPATQSRVTETAASADTTIEVFDVTSPLPRIGLQLGQTELTDVHISALQALELDHVRVDIDATDPARATESLAAAATVAAQIGCSVQAAVFDADAPTLTQLGRKNRELGDVVSCWLIFASNEKVTSASRIAEARQCLGPAEVIAGGTNLYFTELNRQPPTLENLDVINFSVNPQVHSFDNRTILQNASTLMVIAQNAVRLAGAAAISISPITLRPRFNPNATDPSTDVSNDDLPASVDYRQSTWFAAAWTALSLGYLAAPGTIRSVTYCETAGARGILDAETAAPYPVYDFFAALVGATSVRPCESSNPEICDAIIVESESFTRVMIANVGTEVQSVELRGHINARITAPPEQLTIIDLPGG
jgi:D-apionolactonase